jgi:uncharacterized membrane protein
MIWQTLTKTVIEKLLQYLVSIGGGLLLAFETSINFFVPCFIAVIVDVLAAWMLGRRVHKKYPEKAGGKFKSEYKFRIMVTMIVALLAIIVANYVDVHVIKDSDIAVRFVVGVFLFYQVWSVLENWSSENENKIAKALQRIMVNKAERHFNVELSDIMFDEPKKEKENQENGEC